MRVFRSPVVIEWEENRAAEIKKAHHEGYRAVGMDTAERPHLMGVASGSITAVKPARAIVDEIMEDACKCLASGSAVLCAKL